MNERIRILREQALTTSIGGDPEWDPLRQESMAATEGEPVLVREAKVLAWYWLHRSIGIRDGELLVGARSGIQYGETAVRPLAGWRQTFGKPWFPVSDGVRDLFLNGVISMAGNHMTMDYEGILQGGMEGLLAQVEARRARVTSAEPDAERKGYFLDALAVLAKGYMAFCARYGELAAEMAKSEGNPERRRELVEIARQCRQVPARPPRTFREACQCLWFCFLLVPDAPGRVDRYLAPFYRRDIAEGLITRENALELLSCLWLKYFENAGAVQAIGAVHHLTLGGVNPDGSDACSDVTGLCLDVTEDLHLQRPQVGFRWHSNVPDELLQRAVRVLRTGSGSPDLCNDEQIIPALVRTGIAIEDARDFSLSGCQEIIITGKAQMGSVEGFINMPKILRVVLGLEPALGDGVDPARLTGFAGLCEALEAEMALVAEMVHQASIGRDSCGAASPDLVCSLVVRDCIEKASGYNQGGARYNHCNWDVVGIANLADSLAAIRKLVFEDHTCTLSAFTKALCDNWAGNEPLRQKILNECPHFGNDDDSVDLLASRFITCFSGLMKRHKPFRGGEYILGTLAGAENMHIEFGRVTGATPDGRRMGDPLADSIGAAQGRDRQSITALLNSVAKLPHCLLPTATSLNVRLDPKLMETEGGVTRIAAMIRSHFLSGGQHMQINLVNREMLLEAQRHPEEHQDLMVRVAGYSAPFVSLWDDLQAEVMSRTEHKG